MLSILQLKNKNNKWPLLSVAQTAQEPSHLYRKAEHHHLHCQPQGVYHPVGAAQYAVSLNRWFL